MLDSNKKARRKDNKARRKAINKKRVQVIIKDRRKDRIILTSMSLLFIIKIVVDIYDDFSFNMVTIFITGCFIRTLYYYVKKYKKKK